MASERRTEASSSRSRGENSVWRLRSVSRWVGTEICFRFGRTSDIAESSQDKKNCNFLVSMSDKGQLHNKETMASTPEGADENS